MSTNVAFYLVTLAALFLAILVIGLIWFWNNLIEMPNDPDKGLDGDEY